MYVRSTGAGTLQLYNARPGRVYEAAARMADAPPPRSRTGEDLYPQSIQSDISPRYLRC